MLQCPFLCGEYLTKPGHWIDDLLEFPDLTQPSVFNNTLMHINSTLKTCVKV